MNEKKLVCALEAIYEAGRMSDNPQAKYMAEIAFAALATCPTALLDNGAVIRRKEGMANATD